MQIYQNNLEDKIMKKTIRKNVFETNSSSMHTLTISKLNFDNDIEIYENEILNLNGIPNLHGSWRGSTRYEKLAMILGTLGVNEDTFDYLKDEIDDENFSIIESLLKKYNVSKVLGYYDPDACYDDYSNVERKTFDELIEIIEDDSIIITSLIVEY